MPLSFSFLWIRSTQDEAVDFGGVVEKTPGLAAAFFLLLLFSH
jgi:hypothetical protein